MPEGDAAVIIKHATASVFAFGRSPCKGWRLALVHHPRHRRWMIPGGHVEAHENPTQAALRELHEETGMTATLLMPPRAPVPGGFGEMVVPMPHWIVEEHIPGDREQMSHVHVDFLYVALASTSTSVPASRPAVGHQAFTWTDASGIERLEMFDGTRVLARELFGSIEALVEQTQAHRGNSCARYS